MSSSERSDLVWPSLGLQERTEVSRQEALEAVLSPPDLALSHKAWCLLTDPRWAPYGCTCDGRKFDGATLSIYNIESVMNTRGT